MRSNCARCAVHVVDDRADRARALRPAPTRDRAPSRRRRRSRAASAPKVRHDERRRKMPPVADEHRLGHERIGAQPLLDRLRRDLLAAGRDEQFLLAIGDAQIAALVERADVAGVEPAVRRSRPRSRPAGCSSPASRSARGPGSRRPRRCATSTFGSGGPTVPNRILAERHHRQHRRRLRQPVAFENRQPDAEEEPARCRGRAARCRRRRSAAARRRRRESSRTPGGRRRATPARSVHGQRLARRAAPAPRRAATDSAHSKTRA